jgi:hypothetical protein
MLYGIGHVMQALSSLEERRFVPTVQIVELERRRRG